MGGLVNDQNLHAILNRFQPWHTDVTKDSSWIGISQTKRAWRGQKPFPTTPTTRENCLEHPYCTWSWMKKRKKFFSQGQSNHRDVREGERDWKHHSVMYGMMLYYFHITICITQTIDVSTDVRGLPPLTSVRKLSIAHGPGLGTASINWSLHWRSKSTRCCVTYTVVAANFWELYWCDWVQKWLCTFPGRRELSV